MSQIVVPAASRSVITPVAQTTFQVGGYTPLTDTFTKIVDLNDHVSFWLVKVDLPQPEKVYARSSTIRVAGERITAWNYKNRHVTLTIQLLYQSGTTALLAAVRSLLAAIENPPYRLAFAPPNASVLTYADVVAVSHTIPSDAKVILAKAISNISIDFECAPGFSGDRITLSNLVVNPGFEAPSGPSVQVFNDSFANANAYTLGGSTSFAGSTLTLNASATAQFGSPAWGAINQWAIRFEWFAGTTADFFLHRDVSGANYTQASLNGSTLILNQNVASSFHTLSTTNGATLADHTWYWLVMTQFPSAPGTPPDLQATLYADSGGSMGAQIVTSGPVVCVDATAGLTGQPLIFASGGSLNIGGVSGGHTLSLFGPGGWFFAPTNNGATGAASAAWEQSTANSYPGGAVTSYGAARIDVAPAGTFDAFWETYPGGAPAGTSAIPAAPSQTLGLSAWVKSSGVGAGCVQELLALEFDASGSFLRAGTLASKTGPQASWTQLSGTYTTGASCAWLALRLEVVDTTAGASAGGAIWFDNAQCWNQTTTGQTVMPYCELRFPQSPAQLLLTGLQGDMVAPASLNTGIYISGYSVNNNLLLALGQRAMPNAASKLLYGPQIEPSGNLVDVLDYTVWGGYYQQSQSSNNNTATAPISVTEAALLGLYHLIQMVKPNDNHYSLQTIQVAVNEITEADFNGVNWAQYTGVQQALGASSTMWTRADAGMLPVPFAPSLSREDLTQKWLMLQVLLSVSTLPSAANAFEMGPLALMPVDGGYVSALISSLNSFENGKWVYVYNDPGQASALAANVGDAAWRFSLETAPLANAAHAVGGPSLNGLIPIQPLADTSLTLDPTNTAGANGGGAISQSVLTLTDSATGATYPNATDVLYTPLYLYPRQS